MNINHILTVVAQHDVQCLMIGGMNFLLRHQPVVTYDLDLWINDVPDNRRRCEGALGELDAEWGVTDEDWGPVAARRPGWLDRQGVFCMISPWAAIDVFRSVKGLDEWERCRARAVSETTPTGVPYWGLSDSDMLRCQLALPEAQRKLDRVRILRQALECGDRDEDG